MYLVATKRGQRRLGDGYDPTAGTDQLSAFIAANPGPDCPLSLLLPAWLGGGGGSYFACTQQPSLIQTGQQQIQDVADSATKYYGPGSPAAIAAQRTADAQKAMVPGDVASIYKSYLPSDLPVVPFSIPWWLWAVGGVLLISVVKK